MKKKIICISLCVGIILSSVIYGFAAKNLRLRAYSILNIRFKVGIAAAPAGHFTPR